MLNIYKTFSRDSLMYQMVANSNNFPDFDSGMELFWKISLSIHILVGTPSSFTPMMSNF